MSPTLRIALLGGATFLVILLYGLGESADPSAMNPDRSYTDDHSYAREGARAGAPGGAAASPAGEGRRVTLVDRGLQMPRGTQVVPAGWQLTQDLATDPTTGQQARVVLDLRGPRGELIRALGIANYAQMMGTSLEQAWRQLATQRMQGELSDLALGDLRPSEPLARTRGFQRVAQRIGQGMQMEALEAPLRARRAGQPVEGVVYIIHFTSPQQPAGTVQVSAVVSPPGLLAETLRLNEVVANSYQPDPAFEQRLQQLNQQRMAANQAQHQQWMASSQAQHQQRMAANQARFDAHQQTMQERYAANDQAHQQWMDGFRNSGSSAWTGSDYTGHEAGIDAIHERATFQDPYSGQQVHRDGQYDYWYTDGLGDYYGTNDPSFDPHSLDGNWAPIQPLRPNR